MIVSTATAKVMEDVAKERRHQIEDKGHTPERDDEYGNDELAMAGAWFALPSEVRVQLSHGNEQAGLWPIGWRPPTFKERRQNLVIAAALLIAEIERIDRVDQAEKLRRKAAELDRK